MSFEKKIQAELDRHEPQWEDAVLPSVAKYGKQADARIAELEAEVARRNVIMQGLHERLCAADNCVLDGENCFYANDNTIYGSVYRAGGDK